VPRAEWGSGPRLGWEDNCRQRDEQRFAALSQEEQEQQLQAAGDDILFGAAQPWEARPMRKRHERK
jgi:hypothetical protein